jgi:hypothetical protein
MIKSIFKIQIYIHYISIQDTNSNNQLQYYLYFWKWIYSPKYIKLVINERSVVWDDT